MMTNVCSWYYSLNPLKFPECLKHFREGDMLARPIKPGLPDWVKNNLGALHFGGISYLGKFSLSPRVRGDNKESEHEISEQCQRKDEGNCILDFSQPRLLFDFLQTVRVIHYVKDPNAQVKETSLGCFIFGPNEWKV